MMARRVFKYRIELGASNLVSKHSDFTPLHVAMQGSFITLWALVDDASELIEPGQVFNIYPTGFEVVQEAADQYVGTVHDGDAVWHVFQVPTPSQGGGAA